MATINEQYARILNNVALRSVKIQKIASVSHHRTSYYIRCDTASDAYVFTSLFLCAKDESQHRMVAVPHYGMKKKKIILALQCKTLVALFCN